MGQIIVTASVPNSNRSPWRRRRARRWAKVDDLASATVLLAAIPSLPRAALSRVAARMIDRMDEISGDADFPQEQFYE